MNQKNSEKPYKFTSDWIWRHKENWTRELGEYKDKPNVRYLELGVYEGRSFFWFLDNILTHESSEAIAVDTFQGELLERFKYNQRISGFEHRSQVIMGKFSDVLKHHNLGHRCFDIIYIDGAHMPWIKLETAILAWPLLKSDGVLIFDDYRTDDNYPLEFRSKLAIDSFLDIFRHSIEIMHVDFQVILRKKTHMGIPDGVGYSHPLGQYVFDLQHRVLRDSESNKELQLTDPEYEQLVDIIKVDRSKSLLDSFKSSQEIMDSDVFVKILSRFS